MSGVVTYGFCEPFLERLADHIEQEYIRKGKDLRRVAVVFGGKRPALFLKRELARRVGRQYFPPRFFSIDEFMARIVFRSEPFVPSQDMDMAYRVYGMVKEHAPSLLKGREAFAQFLPWANEMLSFIEQLDLELVSSERLLGVEQNAGLGYDVPSDVNRLLENIVVLREKFHEMMLKSGSYSRGFQYFRAAQLARDFEDPDFDETVFANFFYLNRAEERVIVDLYQRKKASLVFQGDERRWPVFERVSKKLGVPIREGERLQEPVFDLRLYSANDHHSQVSTVRHILEGIKDLGRTVVVLPDAGGIIPLVSEITSVAADFNISMGYPLKRSAVISLLEKVFACQESFGEHGYYAPDYLGVMRHPLVKSLALGASPGAVRLLAHSIEEALAGRIDTAFSGSLFIKFEDLHGCDGLFDHVTAAAQAAGEEVSREDARALFEQVHDLCFRQWENVCHCLSLSEALCRWLDCFVEESALNDYPLNTRIASRIYDFSDDLKALSFAGEVFPKRDLFTIFVSFIEREIVAFHGSPLKGLQVLGLFETRSLNFDHVIVMDANEGVLPRLNVYEALIPRDVMVGLGLDRIEQEEEIQRYGFLRLISSAKSVHLVFQENPEKERSRFVEELVWEKQKRDQDLAAVEVSRPRFSVKPRTGERVIFKTPAMVDFLKGCRFSASSVNTYLRDPMEFFFAYVLGLREREDLLSEPENREVGVLVHEVLEEAFRPMIGKAFMVDEKFRNHVQKIFISRYNNSFGKRLRADAFLLKAVIEERIGRLLDFEAGRPVAEVLHVESEFTEDVVLPHATVKFVYRVDRVDLMRDGTVMVLDYKTGVSDILPQGAEEIRRMEFTRDSIAEHVKSFQLPLYMHY
ncbi:MAG TPA: PD-(D/E)XK nuclease family protein, partial [Candidatus Omnitrophota bacterium]|nr:PD-(D/E)XK nuclease family protein [Candidatus Omnitrophota bacterium]